MKNYALIALTFLTLSCALLKQSPPGYSPEMVFIEGGTYTIGDIFENSNSDALPVHEVYVDDFYMAKYEITFEQFDAWAMRYGRSTPNDDGAGRGKRAVVYVTWDVADTFCKSLGMRLPSEAEWEYAARSGGKEQLYSGFNDPDSIYFYAVVDNFDINNSYVVGTLKPNGLGLHDMSGNVFEWVDEFYQFYEKPAQLHNHYTDGIRIIRGGSFSEKRTTTRTYWRSGTLHDVEASDIGFRCADDV